METLLNVALLVPCYNAAAYLPELFASVKAQTTPFAEVLCYDDGSTDKTAAVAESLGARVLRGTTNRGAGYARNRLLEVTQCPWVHFHDADDLLDPMFVELMSQDALRFQTPVLCGMKVLDRSTRAFLGSVSYTELNGTRDYVAYFLNHMGFSIVGIYPLQALREVEGFRENLRGNEDPDLHVRLAMAGLTLHGQPRELVTNLKHSDSFSSQHWQQCMTDKLKCFLRYAEQLKPEHRPLLAREAQAVAWVLYSGGHQNEARQALQLAKDLGLKNVESHRWITRTLSRWTGPEPIFQARLFLNKLRSL